MQLWTSLFPFSWDSPTCYRLKSKGLNPEFQYSLVDVFFFPMCAALFLGDVIWVESWRETIHLEGFHSMWSFHIWHHWTSHHLIKQASFVKFFETVAKAARENYFVGSRVNFAVCMKFLLVTQTKHLDISVWWQMFFFFRRLSSFRWEGMPALLIFRFDLSEKEHLNSNGGFMGEPIRPQKNISKMLLPNYI